MATSALTVYQKPKGQNGSRRQRAGQLARTAAAAVPAEYFAPERRWLTERGPQLARLAQQVKMVTAIVNAEKQFFDVAGNINPVVTPTAQSLNSIAEGDDTQGRSGRTIRAKELDIRLHFYSATAATTSTTVRVFVVKDNSPNGSVPAVGTLFQGGTAGVDGMPVLDILQGRYKWMYDETFTLSSVAGGSDAKVINISMALDHHISFIGAAGSTATLGQGTLWLFALCDITATNAATGAFYSRLRYYDN